MILRILRVLGVSSAATPPNNYTAVNEGRVEFTVDGVAVQAPLVHLIDENGASVEPLTAAQLASAGLASNATMADTNAALGTDGATPPTIAGTGVRGWLRGIYERLGGVLNTRALSSSTDSVAVANFPATQAVTGEFFQATQPVSGTVTADTGLSQPLTDTELRAAAVAVSATALPLPTGAATLAGQTTANTTLGLIRTQLEAVAKIDYQIDAISWLGELYTELGLIKDRLNENANGNLSTAIAEALPAGTNRIGEVVTVPKTDEVNTFFAHWTSGTAIAGNGNFFVIRNPHATRKVRIQAVDVTLIFSGTPAAGRSPFQLMKFSAGTFGATGTPVTPVAAVSGGQAAVAVVAAATAGIAVTNPGDVAAIAGYGIPTQLAATAVYSREYKEAPKVLNQNEALVLQGFGAVTGTTVSISVEWTEE